MLLFSFWLIFFNYSRLRHFVSRLHQSLEVTFDRHNRPSALAPIAKKVVLEARNKLYFTPTSLRFGYSWLRHFVSRLELRSCTRPDRREGCARPSSRPRSLKKWSRGGEWSARRRGINYIFWRDHLKSARPRAGTTLNQPTNPNYTPQIHPAISRCGGKKIILLRNKNKKNKKVPFLRPRFHPSPLSQHPLSAPITLPSKRAPRLSMIQSILFRVLNNT